MKAGTSSSSERKTAPGLPAVLPKPYGKKTKKAVTKSTSTAVGASTSRKATNNNKTTTEGRDDVVVSPKKDSIRVIAVPKKKSRRRGRNNSNASLAKKREGPPKNNPRSTSPGKKWLGTRPSHNQSSSRPPPPPLQVADLEQVQDVEVFLPKSTYSSGKTLTIVAAESTGKRVATAVAHASSKKQVAASKSSSSGGFKLFRRRNTNKNVDQQRDMPVPSNASLLDEEIQNYSMSEDPEEKDGEAQEPTTSTTKLPCTAPHYEMPKAVTQAWQSLQVGSLMLFAQAKESSQQCMSPTDTTTTTAGPTETPIVPPPSRMVQELAESITEDEDSLVDEQESPRRPTKPNQKVNRETPSSNPLKDGRAVLAISSPNPDWNSIVLSPSQSQVLCGVGSTDDDEDEDAVETNVVSMKKQKSKWTHRFLPWLASNIQSKVQQKKPLELPQDWDRAQKHTDDKDKDLGDYLLCRQYSEQDHGASQTERVQEIRESFVTASSAHTKPLPQMSNPCPATDAEWEEVQAISCPHHRDAHRRQVDDRQYYPVTRVLNDHDDDDDSSVAATSVTTLEVLDDDDMDDSMSRLTRDSTGSVSTARSDPKQVLQAPAPASKRTMSLPVTSKKKPGATLPRPPSMHHPKQQQQQQDDNDDDSEEELEIIDIVEEDEQSKGSEDAPPHVEEHPTKDEPVKKDSKKEIIPAKDTEPHVPDMTKDDQESKDADESESDDADSVIALTNTQDLQENQADDAIADQVEQEEDAILSRIPSQVSEALWVLKQHASALGLDEKTLLGAALDDEEEEE